MHACISNDDISDFCCRWYIWGTINNHLILSVSIETGFMDCLIDLNTCMFRSDIADYAAQVRLTPSSWWWRRRQVCLSVSQIPWLHDSIATCHSYYFIHISVPMTCSLHFLSMVLTISIMCSLHVKCEADCSNYGCNCAGWTYKWVPSSTSNNNAVTNRLIDRQTPYTY